MIKSVLLLLSMAVLLQHGSANNGWQSGKGKFIHHLTNIINQLSNSSTAAPASSTAQSTTAATTKKTNRPPSTGIIVKANENPMDAVRRVANSVQSISLTQTMAPPAVRPCFLRPTFCPATSDACTVSRCARIYANGVRIGNRYYKKVKCRLNYCRATCGKAEWFADGRRLVGCSDRPSTVDQPIWREQRKYPRSSRLDSRVLPVERVAQVNKLQRRSLDQIQKQLETAAEEVAGHVQQAAGDLHEQVKPHLDAAGDTIKQAFDKLNPSREERTEQAISAATMKNLTDMVDEQLSRSDLHLERDAVTEELSFTNETRRADEKSSATGFDGRSLVLAVGTVLVLAFL